MIRIITLISMITLSGCAAQSTKPYRQAPVPAVLTAAYAAPCDIPTPLLTNDIMALVLKAEEIATALNKCAIEKAHAVNAYRDARQDVLDWNAGEKVP